MRWTRPIAPICSSSCSVRLQADRDPCSGYSYITPRGFWNGPPDLAVEALCPDDRADDVREKVVEYLAQNVPTVVVVDPDTLKVTVFRPAMSELALAADDVLDLSHEVTGFRCSVRDLFE